MITKKDIEKERTPRGLRQFVVCRKAKVYTDEQELLNAKLKKGI